MTTSSPGCPPRLATQRRPDRKTYGDDVAAMAELVGLTLMPWQRDVIDVALEIDPATGLLAYRDVRITVPRQSGKSTLVLPMVLWRAFATGCLDGAQKMLYSAQTRQDAKVKWLDDYVGRLKTSKLRGRFEVRLANGDEHVRFPTGSKFGIVATTEKAAHGQTLDLAVQDEAFALVDDRMDQAFRPAMITRRQAQFWIVSTAGHAGSVYLKRKVDEGRAAVEADTGSGVAYFEWSAAEDADPADPATWWSCMPALGHTVTEDAIATEFAGMDLPQFRRAYLNQWTDEVSDSIIPLSWWRDRAVDAASMSEPPVFALDVSPARDRVSVVACASSSAGAPQLELVHYGSTTEGVADLVADLMRRHKGRALVVDEAGPAGSLLPDLRAAGLEPVVCTARGMVQACGLLHDAARDGGFVHLGDPIVEGALRASATRLLGDAWAWKRRTSSGDITPLVAFTLAFWGQVTADKPVEAWAAWG